MALISTTETGYMTPTKSALQKNTNIYIGIDGNSVAPIGYIKFTTSFLESLSISTNDVSNWDDLEFSKVTLALQRSGGTIPTTGYKVGVGVEELGLNNVDNSKLEEISLIDYSENNHTLSVTDNIYTFDLTSFFQNLPLNKNFKPSSNAWYLYIQLASGWGSSSIRFAKGVGDLTIEATTSSNAYFRTANGWVKATPYVRTSSGWVKATSYIKANSWEK